MVTSHLGLTAGRIAKGLIWVVYAWVVVTIAVLTMAFFLRLFGANPDAGFAQWVYRSASRSMAPFRGLFEPIVISDDSVLDTSLLFAIIVYGIVAMLLRAGIDALTGLVARQRWRAAHEEEQARHAAAVAGGPTPGWAADARPMVVTDAARPPER